MVKLDLQMFMKLACCSQKTAITKLKSTEGDSRKIEHRISRGKVLSGQGQTTTNLCIALNAHVTGTSTTSHAWYPWCKIVPASRCGHCCSEPRVQRLELKPWHQRHRCTTGCRRGSWTWRWRLSQLRNFFAKRSVATPCGSTDCTHI